MKRNILLQGKRTIEREFDNKGIRLDDFAEEETEEPRGERTK